jgi:hypothetical protein
MSRRFARWVRRAAVGALALAIVSPPALAQSPDDKQPPYDVNGLPQSKQIVPWIFAFLFAALCLLVALKNPHRSHLD